MDKKEIAKELGRSGGKKTLKKYGTEHYRKISSDYWNKHKKKPLTNKPTA